MAAGKPQEVATLRHTVFGRRQICQTAWVHWRGLFCEVKMLPNRKKDLKTVKSEAQQQRKKTVVAENCVSTSIEHNPLKENSSPPAPTRHCFARICCPGSLLHILIEIRFFSRMVCSCTPPFFLLQKNGCALSNYYCATIFAAPELAGLWHLASITAEGQHYGSPENGHSEANCLAIAGCQS